MITVINSCDDRFLTTMQWDEGPLTSRRWRMILDQAMDDLSMRPEPTCLRVHIYLDDDRIIRLTACSFAHRDRSGVDMYDGFILENSHNAIIRKFDALRNFSNLHSFFIREV